MHPTSPPTTGSQEATGNGPGSRSNTPPAKTSRSTAGLIAKAYKEKSKNVRPCKYIPGIGLDNRAKVLRHLKSDNLKEILLVIRPQIVPFGYEGHFFSSLYFRGGRRPLARDGTLFWRSSPPWTCLTHVAAPTNSFAFRKTSLAAVFFDAFWDKSRQYLRKLRFADQTRQQTVTIILPLCGGQVSILQKLWSLSPPQFVRSCLSVT